MRDATAVRVGFVGLGDIGQPMARRIIDAGHEVSLWARRAQTLEPFADHDYRRAADLSQLGRQSDVVGVCVFADADVREVVLGSEGPEGSEDSGGGLLEAMAPGAVILIHSTISAGTVLDLAEHAAERGVWVMDAPVSGFRQRAESGDLTVMVGGPAEAFERAHPVLRAFGSHILHLGPVGSGLKVKALNQVLLLANMNAAALALEAGRALGLDPEATAATLRSATGGSFGLDIIVSRIMVDPDFATLAAKVAAKDLAIYQETAQAAGVPGGELSRIASQGSHFLASLAGRSAPAG